jgi:hypothetical protein
MHVWINRIPSSSELGLTLELCHIYMAVLQNPYCFTFGCTRHTAQLLAYQGGVTVLQKETVGIQVSFNVVQ